MIPRYVAAIFADFAEYAKQPSGAGIGSMTDQSCFVISPASFFISWMSAATSRRPAIALAV